MFQWLNGRGGHYLLLVLVGGGLFFPNLGRPSLWDIDEGNNAEAAREMWLSGNWIVPTFNGNLRVDKPALLYWCQVMAYQWFGVNEFAARFPSALAGLLMLLLTYEFGLQIFDAAAGLLAGLILASSMLFCALVHFANPDALFNLFLLLSMFILWRNGRQAHWLWFVLGGVSMGLATLAKGPVGLMLPMAVYVLFMVWSRRWRALWDARLLLGLLVFAVVVGPWYGLVGAETRGEFLRGFLQRHNFERFTTTMEKHSGPFYYYVLVVALGFLPWSVFLGPTLRQAVRQVRADDPQASTYRFLWSWIAVFVVFFSFAQTKLPNYILPIFPALALLTGQYLVAWRRGWVQEPAWVMKVCLGLLVFAGIGVILGMLWTGNVLSWPKFKGERLPGMEIYAVLGVPLIVGAAAAYGCLLYQRRQALLAVCLVTAFLFIGGAAAGPPLVVERYKAPKKLVEMSKARQTTQDVRIACYKYFQPSLVFYCQREVQRFREERQALEFLQSPLPVYLFVPAPVWQRMEEKTGGRYHCVGQHRDMFRLCDVVVITNQPHEAQAGMAHGSTPKSRIVKIDK
ncbi:MAG: ArnT family glycosyltransferase [Gemmataceae bacterium]